MPLDLNLGSASYQLRSTFPNLLDSVGPHLYNGNNKAHFSELNRIPAQVWHAGGDPDAEVKQSPNRIWYEYRPLSV